MNLTVSHGWRKENNYSLKKSFKHEISIIYYKEKS
jgi:hypothetical protein